MTNQGSNILKALEPYRKLSCVDHQINTVLRHGLQTDALADNAPDIGETISAAKELVRYLTQFGLVAQLSKTVLQMEETRFSTVYLTLKSVQDIFPELREKLEAFGENAHIENIAPDALSFLVTFLEPFGAERAIRRQICNHKTGVPLVSETEKTLPALSHRLSAKSLCVPGTC